MHNFFMLTIVDTTAILSLILQESIVELMLALLIMTRVSKFTECVQVLRNFNFKKVKYVTCMSNSCLKLCEIMM